MSWLSNLWKKNEGEIFSGSVEKIAILFLGQAGKDMWSLSKEAVYEADSQEISNEEKFEYAYKYIVGKLKTEALPYIWKYLVKAIIELAVLWLKKYVQNKF